MARRIAYEAEIDGVVQIFTRALGSPMRTQITRLGCSTASARSGRPTAGTSTTTRWRATPMRCGRSVLPAARRTSSSKARPVAHVSPDGRSAVFLRQGIGRETHMSFWVASFRRTARRQRYARGRSLKDTTFAGGHLAFLAETARRWWRGCGRDIRHKSRLLGDTPAERRAPRACCKREPGSARAAGFTWLPDNRHLVVTRSDGPSPGTHLWLARHADRRHQLR